MIALIQGEVSVVGQDELALKKEQLERVKTEIQARLETSRIEWTTAIREGHSSNKEYTGFIDSYEARCNYLRGLFAEKWQLERGLKAEPKS
jgi:predicted metal-dependent peptidase